MKTLASTHYFNLISKILIFKIQKTYQSHDNQEDEKEYAANDIS